jgi:hypothetical protein
MRKNYNKELMRNESQDINLEKIKQIKIQTLIS